MSPKPTDAGKTRGEKSPWRLVDQYKGRVTELEREIADLRTRAIPEEEFKSKTQKLAEYEARVKAYEDDLRFTNFQKHPEFQEKFQKPYEKAWEAAMGELSELPITDQSTGQSRAFAAEDMLQLLNLSLPEARRVADETYGPLADDVMAHRKTIRELFDRQQMALKEAREKGAEREKTQREEYQKHFGTLAKSVREAFDAANKQILEHPEHSRWFKPIEGDDEGNALLEKGLKFSRESVGVHPFLTPGLSPEQRTEIARRHAAVINRSAAYGRLTREVKKLTAERDSLKKELDQFRASVPGNGKPSGGAPATGPTSARDKVFGALREQFGG